MADTKNKKLPTIRTRAQLDMIIKGLSDQDFGYYVGDWKAHDHKINRIISDGNILRIKEDKYKAELYNLIKGMTNYNEIEKTVKKYFTKFKSDDKINELINTFYLKIESVTSKPSDYASKQDIINWVKFKRKYGIKGEPNFNYNVSVYNLDKIFIKVNFLNSYRWENKSKFTQLYNFIYGEDPNEWSAESSGAWQNLGKIEIKIFQNGSMNIKGDIKKLKPYLYNGITKYNCIIFYNNKKEIFEKRNED